ncbi:eCIS core domain-containing protein [Paenibacillus koleovorans]|uniref:eCIS core domain-containing protein n=1 Tax=Paenibacillus koleovorans TaxID=121608 RepID=UPI000FDA364A|nr:DUF4157 domain-containing protein [Paenibacillus koleovorans]
MFSRKAMSPKKRNSGRTASPLQRQTSYSPKDGGASLSQRQVLQLQKAYGNKAVLQMLRDQQAIQRAEENEEESEALQMKSAGSGKLPEAVQAKMEGSLGHDFSNVNVHADSSKATEVGAHAYTQGNDVHFAPGQYDPSSKSGQQLIGHELTHVIQQSEGRVKPTMQLKNAVQVNDDPALEREADTMGRKAANHNGEEAAEPAVQQKVNGSMSDHAAIQRMPDSKEVKKKLGNKSTSQQAAYQLVLTKLDQFNTHVNRTNVGRSAQMIRVQLEMVKQNYKHIETAIKQYLDVKPAGIKAKYMKNLLGQLVNERRETIRIANEFMANPPTDAIKWSSFATSGKFKQLKLNKSKSTGKTDRGHVNQVSFFNTSKGEGVFKDTKDQLIDPNLFREQNPNASPQEKAGVEEEYYGFGAKIDVNDAHMAERNVALSRLNDLLGGGVIAHAEIALHKSKGTQKKGTFMKKAKGKAAASLNQDMKFTRNSNEKSGEKPFLFDGNLQRYLSRLQLLDAIAMQIDRHTGNYFIQYDENGNVTGVTGIDNDMAFSREEEVKIKDKAYPGLSKFVDKELAERIIALQDDDLKAIMEDLLSPSELTALLARLHKLQTHLQVLKGNNELLSPNEWNEATAMGLLEEHQARKEGEGNYFGSLVEQEEGNRENYEKVKVTVISLLRQDRPFDQIQRITGFSPKDIQKIKDELGL